ncbi:MAG: zinc ABC transporter substrate-binding protein [Oleiphilaceae bacterium]|nr:zinc ABC transporter substrate-binding protein [Oleiphilaceae bacterium]
MRSSIRFVLFALVVLSVPVQASSGPLVVTTFSILNDFARQVVGEHGEARLLAPVGAEVHEYELRPRDFVSLEQADLVFYNGYDLEQWMHQVRATVPDGVPVISLARESGFETLPIVTGEYGGTPDPHLWMDPNAARAYVTVIEEALVEVAPEHADAYRDNAERYRNELTRLDEALREMLAPIDGDNRTLITSEAAFLYFANAYDFHHDGIWGTNSETEGTSEQMMRIIDLIKKRKPRGLFWESTISSRYVEGASRDTGTPYYGPLYVDSLGEEGSGATTYIDMLKSNANLLRETLADE